MVLVCGIDNRQNFSQTIFAAHNIIVVCLDMSIVLHAAGPVECFSLPIFFEHLPTN